MELFNKEETADRYQVDYTLSTIRTQNLTTSSADIDSYNTFCPPLQRFLISQEKSRIELKPYNFLPKIIMLIGEPIMH